mgnify:CR=1 FL=1
MQKILLASLVSAAFAMPAVAAEQADVVVIGAGGAGLSAAVTAHDLGKKVIVLEKMAMVGGNTNRAAGGLNAAETKPQAKLGIKDSIESHYNDTIKGGHYLNNPDLDHKLTDNAKYSVDFINEFLQNLPYFRIIIWFLTDKKTDILSLIHSIITCLFCKHLGFLWH